MVTHGYTTNTFRSQGVPGAAERRARLSGSAWLGWWRHDADLVPAGGFRLAQRPIGRPDQFAQCSPRPHHPAQGPPGPVENGDADGDRQPEDEASVASVLDCDRFPGDVIAQTFRDSPGRGLAGLWQQDRELLTAEPPDQTGSL